jgi:hypothetical protein
MLLLQENELRDRLAEARRYSGEIDKDSVSYATEQLRNLRAERSVKNLQVREARKRVSTRAEEILKASTPTKPLAVGDEVQWTSQGVQQFANKKITGISPDGNFAFVEGSNTGLPISELSSVKPSAPTISKSEARLQAIKDLGIDEANLTRVPLGHGTEFEGMEKSDIIAKMTERKAAIRLSKTSSLPRTPTSRFSTNSILLDLKPIVRSEWRQRMTLRPNMPFDQANARRKSMPMLNESSTSRNKAADVEWENQRQAAPPGMAIGDLVLV